MGVFSSANGSASSLTIAMCDVVPQSCLYNNLGHSNLVLIRVSFIYIMYSENVL